MIYFFKKLNTNKLKAKSHKLNAGMTYVELIVVLSIFSVMSSIAIFNYGDFQAKVDIKNLASDIALKAVEAQKASSNGLLPPLAQQTSIDSTWKPSYGVYFSAAEDTSFVYFADLGNKISIKDGVFDGSSCPGSGECLDKISITKGNKVSGFNVVFKDGDSTANLSDLSITFTRPNTGAVIKSATDTFDPNSVAYAQINIVSPNFNIAPPKGASSVIKIYASGRVQVN